MLKSVIRKHLRWVLLGLFGVGMVSMMGSYADMNTDSTMSNANKQETATFLNGHIFAPMVKVGGDLSKRSPSKVAGNVNVLMPFLPVGNNLNLLGYVSGNMNYYKGRNYIYSGTMGARYMVPTMPMIAGGYVAFDGYNADQDNNAKYSRLTVGAEGWFQKYYGGLNGYYLLNQESSFTLNGEPSIVKHGSDYFASYNQSRERSVHGFELTGGYNVVEGFNVYGGVRFFMAADKAESTKSAVGPYAKAMYTFDFTQQHVYVTQAEFTGEIAYDEINKTYSLIGIRFQFGYGIPYTSGFAHHMIEDPIRQVEFTTYNISTHGETKLSTHDIADTGDGLKNKIGNGNIPNIYVFGNVDVPDTLNVDHKVTIYGDYYTWKHDGKTYKIPLHGGITMKGNHSMFNLKNHSDLTLKGLTLDVYHPGSSLTAPPVGGFYEAPIKLPGDAVPLFMVEDNVDWNITYDTVTVPNTYYGFVMQIRGGKGHLSIVNSTFDHIANPRYQWYNATPINGTKVAVYYQYGSIQVYDGGHLIVDHIANNTFTMDNAYVTYTSDGKNVLQGYDAIGFSTGLDPLNPDQKATDDTHASTIEVYDIRENIFNGMGLYFDAGVAKGDVSKGGVVKVGDITDNVVNNGVGPVLTFFSNGDTTGSLPISTVGSTMTVGKITNNTMSSLYQVILASGEYYGYLKMGDINNNHFTVNSDSTVVNTSVMLFQPNSHGSLELNNINNNVITATKTSLSTYQWGQLGRIAGIGMSSYTTYASMPNPNVGGAGLTVNGDISGNVFNIKSIYRLGDTASTAISIGAMQGNTNIKGSISNNVFNLTNATGIRIWTRNNGIANQGILTMANITNNTFNINGITKPNSQEIEIKTARGIVIESDGSPYGGAHSKTNTVIGNITNNTFNAKGFADDLAIVNINGTITNSGVAGNSTDNHFTIASISGNTFNSEGKALWFHLEGVGDTINISQFTNNTFNVATGAAGYSVFENVTSARPGHGGLVNNTTKITFNHDAGQTNLFDTNAGMTYDITKDGGSLVHYNAADLSNHH